jgi:diphthamide synthase (EF-2-diphthine--ammonia ligase)
VPARQVWRLRRLGAPTWLSWSSGKDLRMALERLRPDEPLEVVDLLTTVSSTADRVARHAVRRELLVAQAVAVALRHVADLPGPCPNGV